MCCSFGFLFVFVLCLIWPMKPVSLDCPLFIIHSVFFNILMLFVFLFTVQVPASCLPFRYLLLVYRPGTCFLLTVQVPASCLPSRYLLLVYHPGTCFLLTIHVPASCLPSRYLLLVYHPGTCFSQICAYNCFNTTGFIRFLPKCFCKYISTNYCIDN
jgi:hypothetical protein